jgi:hypothetical protein
MLDTIIDRELAFGGEDALAAGFSTSSALSRAENLQPILRVGDPLLLATLARSACCLPVRQSTGLRSVILWSEQAAQSRRNYQPYSFNLRYRVVLPMPSMWAALSLSSFVTFKAFWIACFSRTAKGTTFRPGPEDPAEVFFLLDLRIVLFCPF